MKKTFL